ncbi:MAG: MFS transporter [Coriobacteriia bacterium]|nr:MFS transporter [Coriobacteriia bacterium]MCL2136660.1 MFS transporter [Coriobacteriia bacterium]
MSSNAVPVVEQKSTLPRQIPWVYAIYSFLSSFGTTMPLTFLVFFITEYTGVSPITMATVYSVARIADLIVSLFSGAVIQRQKRVRPWLIIIPLISGLGGVVSFSNPNIALAPKLVILIIGYCCIHFPMNFSTVVGNTILMKIAGANPANRVAITQMQLRGMSAARIGISAISMPLILFFLNIGLPGYFYVAIIYFIVFMIANYMLYVISAPYEPKDAEASVVNAQRVSIGQMYKAAGSNKAILVLLFSAISVGIAGQVFGTGVMYYYNYSIGDVSYQALAGTIAGFVALGTAIICPPIARRLGKKNSSVFMYCWVSLIYVVIMLFGDGNVWLYIIATSVMSLGTSISGTWGINLWLDAAEVQLYETGVDNRPFLMSLNNIPIKLGFIASGPIFAYILESSGYVANPGGLSTMADTGWFVTIWIGITLALYIVAALVFTLGYRIKDDYAAECAAENAERAAAAAAEAAAAAPGSTKA